MSNRDHGSTRLCRAGTVLRVPSSTCLTGSMERYKEDRLPLLGFFPQRRSGGPRIAAAWWCVLLATFACPTCATLRSVHHRNMHTSSDKDQFDRLEVRSPSTCFRHHRSDRYTQLIPSPSISLQGHQTKPLPTTGQTLLQHAAYFVPVCS